MQLSSTSGMAFARAVRRVMCLSLLSGVTFVAATLEGHRVGRSKTHVTPPQADGVVPLDDTASHRRPLGLELHRHRRAQKLVVSKITELMH